MVISSALVCYLAECLYVYDAAEKGPGTWARENDISQGGKKLNRDRNSITLMALIQYILLLLLLYNISRQESLTSISKTTKDIFRFFFFL